MPLLEADNLEYEGAFRLPNGKGDANSFSYGGYALAFNPHNESLILTGHDRHQRSAEVSIPSLRIARNPGDLEIADFVQPFTDALEGKLHAINPDNRNAQKIGGHLVSGTSLVVSAYSSYDAAGSQSASHFLRQLDLAISGQVVGPLSVGPNVHFTSAYMAPIPEQWRIALGGSALTGNCCRSIIGYQSHGPAAFAFSPEDLLLNDRITASPLVYYPSENPLGPGIRRTNRYFNLTTRINGAVIPENTASLLFFGSHGVGKYCYGSGEECGDPAMTYQGVHAYPYVYQVWAYDIEQIIKAKREGRRPYTVSPYNVWEFNLPFEADGPHTLGGAAYARSQDRIYISQIGTDQDARPIIHAFSIRYPALDR